MSQSPLCLTASIKFICITPSCYSSHRFTIKNDVIRSHGKFYGRKTQYRQPYLSRVYEIVDKGQGRSCYDITFAVFLNFKTYIHTWKLFEACLNHCAWYNNNQWQWNYDIMFLKFWNLYLDRIALKKQWTLPIVFTAGHYRALSSSSCRLRKRPIINIPV